MITTTIRDDASKIVYYNYPQIPLYVKQDYLSDYVGMSSISHWHDDLEFIVILQGKMIYSVNGNDYLLKEGQGIFINSRQFHYGRADHGVDCVFLCIRVPLALLDTTSHIRKTYILPLLNSENYAFCILDALNPSHTRMMEYLNKIQMLCQAQEPAFELTLESYILYIWKELYDDFVKPAAKTEAAETPHLDELRRMVDYIQNHYSEKITLEQIAASGNVCRSSCCKLFQQLLHTSPIGYLIDYRIHKSMELLLSTKYTVTEIAYLCGFSNTSYYIKMFKRVAGASPLEYRKIGTKKS